MSSPSPFTTRCPSCDPSSRVHFTRIRLRRGKKYVKQQPSCGAAITGGVDVGYRRATAINVWGAALRGYRLGQVRLGEVIGQVRLGYRNNAVFVLFLQSLAIDEILFSSNAVKEMMFVLQFFVRVNQQLITLYKELQKR